MGIIIPIFIIFEENSTHYEIKRKNNISQALKNFTTSW